MLSWKLVSSACRSPLWIAQRYVLGCHFGMHPGYDDYDRSNSGGDERINLAEDNDSDLDEQCAG